MEINYECIDLKNLKESSDYQAYSELVIRHFRRIIKNRITKKQNNIKFNITLKIGLSNNNVDRFGEDIVKAWLYEILKEDKELDSKSSNIRRTEKQTVADILLQFKISNIHIINQEVLMDVKTSSNMSKDNKILNIISFERLRSSYTNNPDYLFIIIFLKYKIQIKKESEKKNFFVNIDVTDFEIFDLKFISDFVIKFSGSSNIGQIQIKNENNTSIIYRTTSEFCEMLDKKNLFLLKKDLKNG